jgi:CRISPR-associated endonuclease/helicase Cas3
MPKSVNLGKPSGITLKDHTLHVIEQAGYILSKLTFLEKKYKRLVDGNLQKELKDAATFHDWGKAHSQWQKACQLDFEMYRNWRIKNKLSSDENSPDEHRRFEHEMRKQEKVSAPHLMVAKIRHEFASLLMIEGNSEVEVSTVVKAAIAAHHGKLGARFEHRWKKDGTSPPQEIGSFYKYWEQFRRLSYKGKKDKLSKRLLERYKFSAVRSLLQLADTRASRKEGEGELASYEFEKFELKNKYQELRPVQKAAEELANEPIAILRAPTGSGKTYASLLWAEQQIKAGRADRLVIAMPTRFTSNALAISVAEQIDETGLFHSSAWFNRYGDISDSEVKKNAREAHRMARYLATPVSVCTIDHLLICLTGTKEYHHSTFFFLANSAVVFDEADFYDPFVQANIVVLLEVLKVLEVPVLIMSATVPDSARVLYNIEAAIKIPINPPLKSTKYLQWIDKKNNQLTKEGILEKMLEEGTGIIYANTVARAFEYYRLLENHSLRKDIPLIIYHSRFTEPSKKDIESKLIQALGKDAWEDQQNKPVEGIAIMTQIGEMSVNISAPIMLSDLCPWDRLAQRIGRLVRFEKIMKGVCYVIEPQKEGELYPAPYGEYDRKKKGWKAFQVLLKTKKKLQEDFTTQQIITPEQLEQLVNKLYPSAPDIIGHAQNNQRNYRELIKDNWLILPDRKVEEDEGHVDKWSSRHIPPQWTVLTYFVPRFTSYHDYQEHVLQYGVSCPVYAVEKEMRKEEDSKIKTSKIIIGKSEEEITAYYIDEENYNKDLGLAFLYE